MLKLSVQYIRIFFVDIKCKFEMLYTKGVSNLKYFMFHVRKALAWLDSYFDFINLKL